jgi:hypothetical protein
MRHLTLLAASITAFVLALPQVATAVPAASRTVRTSVASDGTQGNGMSGRFSRPAISTDGNVTTFDSIATNLVPDDTNRSADVFAHDASTGETERVSVSTAGGQANDDSQNPTIDRHGQRIAFDSNATNLVPSDDNRLSDVHTT